jgi:hypothetical protein
LQFSEQLTRDCKKILFLEIAERARALLTNHHFDRSPVYRTLPQIVRVLTESVRTRGRNFGVSQLSTITESGA